MIRLPPMIAWSVWASIQARNLASICWLWLAGQGRPVACLCPGAGRWAEDETLLDRCRSGGEVQRVVADHGNAHNAMSGEN